ncbi:MAG: hypothetical protein B7Z66_10275 [Chromatiales bacterium 21-64-14]|nr:MAG: hypothetical protein B7Z66_10275 [Chromatiales bacterium 21-64-14]HQU16398.1 hypothetical protein [Gammaproteobacteria bacterium]
MSESIANHQWDVLALDATAREIPLALREDSRNAALALVNQARHTLRLFTRDLDPALYDHLPFLEAVRRLATRGRLSGVQIMILEPQRVVRRGHRLVELSRRLTTGIELRRPQPEYRDHTEHFLIADETGLLFRPLEERYEGWASFRAPLAARVWLKFFAEAWSGSEPDPELQRLYL